MRRVLFIDKDTRLPEKPLPDRYSDCRTGKRKTQDGMLPLIPLNKTPPNRLPDEGQLVPADSPLRAIDRKDVDEQMLSGKSPVKQLPLVAIFSIRPRTNKEDGMLPVIALSLTSIVCKETALWTFDIDPDKNYFAAVNEQANAISTKKTI